MSSSGYERAKKYARELRRNQTGAERILWKLLRNRKFVGRKFLRQHPIFTDDSNKDAFYIVDFYCHESKLAIELDGQIHEYTKSYDSLRTEILKMRGITVIRFKNEEVEEDLPSVLDRISNYLTQPPTPFSPREKGDKGDE